MDKCLKKIGIFLTVLLMLTGLCSMAVMAAPDTDRNAFYVQIPSDWKNPCVWAWDSDGNNAFEAWPGEEMEADPENEGWYYIWLPSFANHVIVSANDGNVQTEEQILDTNAAWMTIKAADEVEVTYEKQTTGEAPAYTEKFTIHAKVDDGWKAPCLWAWSAPDGTNAFEAWPGKAMKKGEDGWYTAKAPVFVNSVIINGNEGSVQTEDISIDPAEIWITVEADGAYDFSYADPDKAAIPDITVHVATPSDWESPCLWAWSAPDGTNVFASWPGEALEEGENGWLQKTVPGWINSVIVNGNEGSVQTTDISVESGKDIWLVVNGAEDYSLSYEEPELTAETETPEADTDEGKATEAVKTDTTENTEQTEKKSSPAGPIAAAVIVVAAGAGIGIAAKKKKAGN